jgi:hypothetical protein
MKSRKIAPICASKLVSGMRSLLLVPGSLLVLLSLLCGCGQNPGTRVNYKLIEGNLGEFIGKQVVRYGGKLNLDK